MMEKMRDARARALCSTLFMIFVLAPFFRPPSFFSMESVLGARINQAYAIWKALSMLLIGLLFVAKPRLSPLTAVLAAYQCLALASTLINHSDYGVYDWANNAASIGALCLLADLAADQGDRALRALVKALFLCLGTLLLINLVSVILVRGGYYQYPGKIDYYFMGLDNSHSFFILPFLPVAVLYAWNRRWPLPVQIALLAVFTVSVYITWVASAVVAVSAFLALFLVWRLKRCRRVCNIGVYYGVLAAIFVLIVMLRATEQFAFIIENVLHKDVTLSHRTPLWAACLQYIRARPWLGNGIYTSETMHAMVGANHCHNVLLESLFETGVAGFAVYLAALGLLVKPLMRTRDTFGGYILAAGFFSTMLLLQAESPGFPYPFYLLFALCYHAEQLVPALDPDAEITAP